MTDLGLAVMYHYVLPRDPAPPRGIRPLFVDEFEHQLDALGERYDIVHPEEFLRRIEEGAVSAKPACMLTFDDGTRDHLEVVAPILEKRGLRGLFFVLSWPIEERRMPLAHAVHWALSLDEHAVWDVFQRVASERGLDLGSEEEARTHYHYEDSLLRQRIKFAANVRLAPEDAEFVLKEIVASEGMTLEALVSQWFLGASEVKELASRGHVIGMHGQSHRSLQVLGAAGIADEVAVSHACLTELLVESPSWFACPFGGHNATPETVRAMHQAIDSVGVRAALSVEKGFVSADTPRFAIPRFDAIDFPPRKPFA